VKLEPAALFRGRLTIALLGADRIRIDRKPLPSTGESASTGRTRLPIAIELQRLSVPSIELAAPVLGTPATLSLEGHAQAYGHNASTQLTIDRTDGTPGRLEASFAVAGEPARLTATLDIEEPSGKLLNALLSRDDSLPLRMVAHGEGPVADWHSRVEARAGDVGRLVTDVALSSGAAGNRVTVDGELSATGLLPSAIRALIGDEARFHVAGGEGTDGRITVDAIELHLAAAAIAGSGSLGAGPGGAAAGNLRVVVDDLGTLSSLLGRPTAGSATLVLTAAGTRAKPSVTAILDGQRLRLADKGAEQVAARLAADATAPIGDPKMRIAFSGEGRAARIDAAVPGVTDQDLSWRLEGSSSADGSALEVKELVVEGPGATLTATGRGDRETLAGSADLHLAAADLSRFDSLAGRMLAGKGAIDAALSHEESGDVRIKIRSRFQDLATGLPVADALLGGRLAIDIAGSRAANGDIAVEDTAIDAANLHFSGKGTRDIARNRTEGSFALSLPRLDVLSENGRTISGRARLDGTLDGSADAPALEAVLKADDFRSGEMRFDRLTARLKTEEDPAPAGTLDAEFTFGRLAGKLNARGALSGDGKSLDLSELKLAAGATTLEAALRTALDTHLTSGTIRARSGDLSQLSTLAGMPLTGKLELDARLATEGGESANFSLTATDLGVAPGDKVERFTAKGRFSDLFGQVGGNADLALLGGKFGGASLEHLHASVQSRRAGTLSFAADLRGSLAAPVELAAAGEATIGADQISARLGKFAGRLGSQTLRLDQPLRIVKDGGDVSLAGLKLALGTGQVSGAASLKRDILSAKLAAHGVPLAVAEAFAGKGRLSGSLDADVDLHGAVERPIGSITLTARGVRVVTSERPGLPSADVTAEARLQPNRLLLNARVADAKGDAINLAGALPIKITGHPFAATVPRDGALSLSINGDGQLENLTELLPIGEDRLSGRYHLDLRAAGTVASPSASGEVTLAEGHYESLVYGTVLDGVTIDLAGDRDKIVLRQFSATDGGKGTLKIGGTVLLAAKPGPAFDATAVLNAFQLIHRDNAIAHGSGDIKVSGALAEPRVVARLKVDDAQLYLAERLPPSVRRIDVTEIDSRTGEVFRQPEPPSSAPPIVVALDIKVDLPGQIFVRGRGLDSEWKGQIDVGGTSAAPGIQGKIEVVRGTMNFLGKTLDLTRGTVVLAGGNKIEPLLDFLAEATGAQVKAQVAVTGTLENPTIKLTSDPPMPQDQVLAQLLFGRDVSQLTPMEGLQIAQAAADLASGGPGVIDQVRLKFGLDRLSIGSSDQNARSGSSTPSQSSGAAGGIGKTTLSAGKYVAPGVLVGIDQGVSGESRAKVEVEINRHVTVNSAASASRGNSVGLNWKLDY